MVTRIVPKTLPGRSIWRKLGLHPLDLDFITLHYFYFIGTCLLSSLIFYGASTPAASISYTDSLFVVVSAMTEAGLNTVNLSEMNTFQQWLLWMHIMAGSAIFVSISVVHFRKRAFEKRFGDVVKAQKEQRLEHRRTFSEYRHRHSMTSVIDDESSRLDLCSSSVERHPPQNLDAIIEDLDDQNITRPEVAATADSPSTVFADGPNSPGPNKSVDSEPRIDRVVFGHDNRLNSTAESVTRRRWHSQAHDHQDDATSISVPPVHRPGLESLVLRSTSNMSSRSEIRDPQGFLSHAIIGRNSQIRGLSREERDQLGGVEYRALSLLAWVVPTYFILWQLISTVAIGAWMARYKASVAEENGINPWWLGAFNAVSAFNNSGMSLLDANMIPFQDSPYLLFTMGLLILAGNTAYPIFLRLIFWTMFRLLPDSEYYQDWRETLQFVLKHPRRVYTNLFPSRPTWWLTFILIVLNGIDWAAFELLNIGNDAITSIPTHARVMDGLFQALAVRSGGFYVVAIPSLRIGVQVLYVIMMYISVYPVVITMRNSNVYEERSLGIYGDDSDVKEDEKAKAAEVGVLGYFKRRVLGKKPVDSRAFFLQQQVRGQLAQDLSWLVFAIFLVVCIEVSNFERDPVTYSVFNVMFEIVSGYGCVGITTGLPNESYSFSGGWHTVSKLILCAVMIRGRHRGLPVAIDRAILLPAEVMEGREEAMHDVGNRGQDLADERV